MTPIIETERLILRTWNKEDAEAYFQINKDPKLIECLRGPLTVAQVGDFLKRDINGDFAHPKLEANHPLSHHILYRLTKDEFLK